MYISLPILIFLGLLFFLTQEEKIAIRSVINSLTLLAYWLLAALFIGLAFYLSIDVFFEYAIKPVLKFAANIFGEGILWGALVPIVFYSSIFYFYSKIKDENN